ncbi:hypothetical protein BVH03_17410 [Pseudomonas sp. PA15(2017)]|uniref:hypothetical protein n=1 Tax=Pseudomonas sp. PA15(2017) TaxID=1932111 RepID=UPI00095EB925|nr:hypothetical protein [Pseudomonas sp. PA15(2017)]OLU25437.1 hypothetical protein BVH03_17410 [Pseudomonas sp. PA15(2017)]
MNTRTSAVAIEAAINAANNAEGSLRRTRQFVRSRSGAISAAGIGLSTIGDLLGADASEHFIDSDMQHGLANAVLALGKLIYGLGNDLWEVCEEDQEALPCGSQDQEGQP